MNTREKATTLLACLGVAYFIVAIVLLGTAHRRRSKSLRRIADSYGLIAFAFIIAAFTVMS